MKSSTFGLCLRWRRLMFVKIKQVALKSHIIDFLEGLFLAHILPANLEAY